MFAQRVKQKDSKINEHNLANMPECNLILLDLYYFLNFHWATYEPIVSLKQNGSSLSRQYLNISRQSALVGAVSFSRRGENALSRKKPPSRYHNFG